MAGLSGAHGCGELGDVEFQFDCVAGSLKPMAGRSAAHGGGRVSVRLCCWALKTHGRSQCCTWWRKSISPTLLLRV